MGLESGSFLDDLVASNPAGTDSKSQGDNHIRLIKSLLKATFIGATRAFHFPAAPAAKTSSYSIVLTDQNSLIRGDASSGAITFTLPLGSAVFSGYEVTIMKSDSSSNDLTIDGNGAETINGASTSVISTQYVSRKFRWEGSEWKIISASELITAALLSLVIGTNTQAWDAALDDIAALALDDGEMIVGDGSNWVAESGQNLRESVGGVIQTAYTSTGAVSTSTTTIPNDDTIPQKTEGAEFMTLTITPKSATSKLIFNVGLIGEGTTAGVGIVALFQDATSDALTCTFSSIEGNGTIHNLILSHQMTSGTTSATTFKVRAGSQSGTFTFNGISGSRKGGGVMSSFIRIIEVGS